MKKSKAKKQHINWISELHKMKPHEAVQLIYCLLNRIKSN